jgi:hypothetical protein
MSSKPTSGPDQLEQSNGEQRGLVHFWTDYRFSAGASSPVRREIQLLKLWLPDSQAESIRFRNPESCCSRGAFEIATHSVIVGAMSSIGNGSRTGIPAARRRGFQKRLRRSPKGLQFLGSHLTQE